MSSGADSMMHLSFEVGEVIDEMEEEDEFNEMSVQEMLAGRQVSNSVTAEIRHLIREIDDILEELHKLRDQIENTDKLVRYVRAWCSSVVFERGVRARSARTSLSFTHSTHSCHLHNSDHSPNA